MKTKPDRNVYFERHKSPACYSEKHFMFRVEFRVFIFRLHSPLPTHFCRSPIRQLLHVAIRSSSRFCPTRPPPLLGAVASGSSRCSAQSRRDRLGAPRGRVWIVSLLGAVASGSSRCSARSRRGRLGSQRGRVGIVSVRAALTAPPHAVSRRHCLADSFRPRRAPL